MKYLIIGCGSISRMHAQALQRMGEEIAICDPIPQNLAATGEQFGIAERYASYEEAFANTAFDAVIVCTPTHLHEAPWSMPWNTAPTCSVKSPSQRTRRRDGG